MGDIFEQLLLINEIISKEELEYYRKIGSSSPQPRHLGEILLEKGLIDSKTLQQLQKAEALSKERFKTARNQKRDKHVLEVIQKLGIVRQEELAACIRERHRAEAQGKQVFLTDLLIEKGCLTPYLVSKFYRKAGTTPSLPEGVKSYEDVVINIPKFLQERFLGKIAVKNGVLSQAQLSKCWQILKEHWPRKSLTHIMLEKNIADEKKLYVLLGVLKQSLPEKYPYFYAQVRDTRLARLLVKRNFLSPWRINKTLMAQWKKIQRKEYVSIRELLVTEGYLSAYQFDVVLKKYGDLVSSDMPGLFLMPPDEALQGEDMEKAVGSGISLLLDEDNIGSEEELDVIEEIEIEDIEDLVHIEEEEAAKRDSQTPTRKGEAEEPPNLTLPRKGGGEEMALPKIPTQVWKDLAKGPQPAQVAPDEIHPLDIENLDFEDEMEAEAVEVYEETFEDMDFDMEKMLDEMAADSLPEEPHREMEKKKKEPHHKEERK